MTDERFSVLIVCHANLCRSPLAERLARRTFLDRMGALAADFDVVSAGTHAWTGRPMHPLAAEVLREREADDAQFASQRLTADLVARADLILTAARRQRSECVRLVPAAVRRAFTIPQFGRLCAAMPEFALASIWPPTARLHALIKELQLLRSRVPVAVGDADDLRDPVQLPIEAFRQCATEIQETLDAMTELIAPI